MLHFLVDCPAIGLRFDVFLNRNGVLFEHHKWQQKGQRLIVHRILRKWARGGDVGSVEWLEHGDMKYKMNFGLRWEG